MVRFIYTKCSTGENDIRQFFTGDPLRSVHVEVESTHYASKDPFIRHKELCACEYLTRNETLFSKNYFLKLPRNNMTSTVGKDTAATLIELVTNELNGITSNCVRKTRNSNSLGNRYQLKSQRKRTRTSALRRSAPAPQFPPDDDEITNLLDRMKGCCSFGSTRGCIRQHYTTTTATGSRVDYTAACEYFRRCRMLTVNKGAEEKEVFLKEQLRASIIPQTNDNLNVRLNMQYKLIEGKTACRTAFCMSFDFSKHMVVNCLKRIKESDTGQFYSLNIKEWTDATIHEGFTYDSTADLFLTEAKIDGK